MCVCVCLHECVYLLLINVLLMLHSSSLFCAFSFFLNFLYSDLVTLLLFWGGRGEGLFSLFSRKYKISCCK